MTREGTIKHLVKDYVPQPLRHPGLDVHTWVVETVLGASSYHESKLAKVIQTLVWLRAIVEDPPEFRISMDHTIEISKVILFRSKMLVEPFVQVPKGTRRQVSHEQIKMKLV